MIQKKIESVKNLSRPLTSIDIWSFLGLANYHSRFVEAFSAIVTPLTNLTMKKGILSGLKLVKRVFKSIKTNSLQPSSHITEKW